MPDLNTHLNSLGRNEALNEKVADFNEPIIKEMVEKGAIVVTDEWGAYNGLDKNFTHEVLKHNEGEFVNTNNFHTNSVEGFWSLLKRGIL
jgi:hypothetical protein